jgi:DnaJ homolog subfamily C member 8
MSAVPGPSAAAGPGAGAAEELKGLGNAAFAAGNYARAVELYSAAIDRDGGRSHVLYSNRSAALLARGGPGDALAAISDANTALRLDPGFAKAYHRKGCALVAIGEVDDAIAVFSAGIRVDPASAALKEGLQQATAAAAAKRMREAVAAQAASDARGAASGKEAALDDALAAFEAELAGLGGGAKKTGAAGTSSSSASSSATGKGGGGGGLAAEIAAHFDAEAEDTWDAAESRAASSSSAAGGGDDGGSDDSEGEGGGGGGASTSAAAAHADPAAGLDDAARAAQTARLAAADLGTGAAQIDRLMGPRHAWLNLNPYEVLQLPATASEDDIRARFRRLSALVHPDKNASQPERAADAFNEVRRAQETLLDGAKRAAVLAVIAGAAKEARRARRRKLRTGVPESVLPPAEEALAVETRKAFAEREMRRRNYEARIKAEAAREAAAEYDAAAAAKEEHKASEAWAAGREKRMEDWQSFQGAKRRRTGEAGGDAAADGAGGSAASGGGPGLSDVLRFGAGVSDYKRRWR